MKVVGTIRTEAEILARFIERRRADWLGWEVECYLPYIGIDTLLSRAEELGLNSEALSKVKEALAVDPFQQTPREAAIEYLAFAFDKAHGKRGISSERSFKHYLAWLWLISDEWAAEIESMPYNSYGLPILRRICAMLEVDPREHGDG